MTSPTIISQPVAMLTVNEDGSLTIPSDILELIGLVPDDIVRLIREQDQFVMRPMRFVADQVAKEFTQRMKEQGVSLQDLLDGLDDAAEEVFQETYGDITAHVG